MSQNPPYIVYHSPPSNGLGIAGFIVSLVGLISCGLLSPVGLVLSFIALFKRPRGFAVAGFVVGLLGSVWAIVAFIVVGIGSIFAALGIGMAMPYVKAEIKMDQLAQIVQLHKAPDGSFPADLASITGIDHQLLKDPWGRPFRLVHTASGDFDITSDGPDGVQGTDDDVSWHKHAGQNHHGRHAKSHPVEID